MKWLVVGVAIGVLLTIFTLYTSLEETRREQRWGLLLSPEEVKGRCGKPQADDGYKLTYFDGNRHLELQFMGMQHRMYLADVRWSAETSDPARFKAVGGTGDINRVTRAP